MNFVFDPSLELYLPLYELDGSSFMSKDACGHICLVTGALWGSQGRTFDGGDDYIDITPTSWAQIQAITAFTFGIWFKSETDSSDYLWSISDKDDAGSYVGVQLTSSGGIVFNLAEDGGWPISTISAETGYNDGDWHLVQVTQPAADDALVVTVDAVALTMNDTGSGSGNEGFVDVGNLDKFLIGDRMRSGSLDAPYEGVIGEVWLYNRGLTPQEIQQNYLATKGRYQ